MKILHARVDGCYGGVERLILHLADGLRARSSEYENIIVPMGFEGKLGEYARQAGYRTRFLPMKSRLDFTAFSRMKRILLDEQPDLVCTWCVRSDVIAGTQAAKRGIPWVASVANPKGEYTNPLMGAFLLNADAWALKKADAVITLSTEGVMLLKNRLGQVAPIHRIPNGIPVDMPMPKSNRAAFNLPEDALVIGSIGRLAPVKGYDLLIEAAVPIIKQFPKAHFIIAGEGPEQSNLEAQVTRLDLREQFHFCGFIEDIHNLLVCLDIFVLPSRTEGHPLALLEAMAAGIPCVATNVGGIPEIAGDGGGVLLVPGEDVRSLVRIIGDLLSDPEERRSLGRQAQERVRQEFSFDKTLDQYKSLYQNVCNCKRAGRNGF